MQSAGANDHEQKQIHDSSSDTDGSKFIRAGKISDDKGVDGIVKLL